MSRSQLRLIAVLSSYLVLTSVGSSATVKAERLPEGKADRSRRAQELVHEALHREIYGMQEDRARLLHEAVSMDPESPVARWHQGYVRFQNNWVHADDVPIAASRLRHLAAYDREQASQPDTIAGHTKMANVSRELSLKAQEQAHLLRVLDFDPNHAEARSRLGYTLRNGEWMSAEDRLTADERAQRAVASMEKWSPKLKKLLDDIEDRGVAKRERALASIRELRDVGAITAMERLLSWNELAADAMIDAFAQMQHPDASLSLARNAVLSPFESIRYRTAQLLRQCPRVEYVPHLLSLMQNPINTQARLTTDADGRIVYRHEFLREGAARRDLLTLDTEYRRVRQTGGDGRDSARLAVNDANSAARSREWGVMLANLQALEVNNRVAAVLNVATEQPAPFPAIPNTWWQWWGDENETSLGGEKQLYARYQSRGVAVVDRVPDSGIGVSSGSPSLSASPMRQECFVAGTPVWTAKGMREIQQIRVGDLVLAQEPVTGELAYKSVVRTTVRPPKELVRLEVAGDTLTCTGGHLFWVSGDGWTKARNLTSGGQLHALTGSVPIWDTAPAEPAETYNLVVADFHTYFVGQVRILSHDNSDVRPARTQVPGLSR